MILDAYGRPVPERLVQIADRVFVTPAALKAIRVTERFEVQVPIPELGFVALRTAVDESAPRPPDGVLRMAPLSGVTGHLPVYDGIVTERFRDPP